MRTMTIASGALALAIGLGGLTTQGVQADDMWDMMNPAWWMGLDDDDDDDWKYWYYGPGRYAWGGGGPYGWGGYGPGYYGYGGYPGYAVASTKSKSKPAPAPIPE